MYNGYEYYVKFGWRFNPFTLTISPDLMVGYSEQSNELMSHVFNGHKFAAVFGPTGAGKTTLLQWLKVQLKAYRKFNVIYLAKPPRDENNLVDVFKSSLGYNFLDSLLFRKVDVYNLPKFVESKRKGRQIVLLVDEAHEASQQVLEWLRTIVDAVSNMGIVFAGLPIFEKVLETKLPTLFMRITTKVWLNSLSRIETEDLIRKRIDKAGGEGIKPFTQDAIDEIYRITGGFPREIIKICDTLVKEAFKRNVNTITSQLVMNVARPREVVETDIKFRLSKKQLAILQILNEKGKLTPSQLAEVLGGEYKNKSNAVRAMNNILKRLMGEGLVERQKVGNAYVYLLSGKAKTLFAEA